MNNPYWNRASFGKRQEYIAIAELLKRGYDVYITLVDDQQIDCIVRHDADPHVTVVELQIKARSQTAIHYTKFDGLKCDPLTQKLRHEFSKYEGFGYLESYLNVTGQYTGI